MNFLVRVVTASFVPAARLQAAAKLFNPYTGKCTLVVHSTFADLYTRRPSLVPEHSHHPRKKPRVRCSHSPSSPSSPRSPTALCLVRPPGLDSPSTQSAPRWPDAGASRTSHEEGFRGFSLSPCQDFRPFVPGLHSVPWPSHPVSLLLPRAAGLFSGVGRQERCWEALLAPDVTAGVTVRGGARLSSGAAVLLCVSTGSVCPHPRRAPRRRSVPEAGGCAPSGVSRLPCRRSALSSGLPG